MSLTQDPIGQILATQPGSCLTDPLVPRRFEAALQLCDDEVADLGAGHALVFDGFLGPTQSLACAHAIRDVDRAGHMTPAFVGRARRHRPQIRGDRTVWGSELALAPPLQRAWAAFEALREILNVQAWLGLRRFEMQLACFPGGGPGYQSHIDSVRGNAARRVTAICYLNPDWEIEDGGVLHCISAAGSQDVEPRLDRLVVFRSELLEHQVRPARRARYAITAWYGGPEGG